MILYVSWGGIGWAATVRQAMRRAMLQDEPADSKTADSNTAVSNTGQGERGLRYLAILDDEHFADLDHNMLSLVTEELHWLLDAQLDLTRRQLGAGSLEVEVVVRTGDVADAVVDVIEQLGPAEVLIGAPLPTHERIESLTSSLRARLNHDVSILAPQA